MRKADLLRFIDGEGNAGFRDRVTAHLNTCPGCAAFSDELRLETNVMLQRLTVLDEVRADDKLPATFAELAQRAPRVEAASPKIDWRWAAAIVLLLGIGAVIARPAAAWLASWFDSVAEQPIATSTTPPQSPAATLPDAARDPNTAAYRFAPMAKELTIDFAVREEAAQLIIRVVNASEATLELSTYGKAPAVLILPAGVRVNNADATGTTYELQVPAATHDLTVSVAATVLRRIEATALAADRTVRISLNPD